MLLFDFERNLLSTIWFPISEYLPWQFIHNEIDIDRVLLRYKLLLLFYPLPERLEVSHLTI